MSASNNKDAIDFKLALFVKMVRDGKIPSKDLLNLVADGVDAFRKSGKPWTVKKGRKQRLETSKGHIRATKAYLLHRIGLENNHIADYLSDDTRTARRLIKEGEVSQAAEGWFVILECACAELLENKYITQSHKDKVKKELELQRNKREIDNRDPLLYHTPSQAEGQDKN